MKKGNVKQVAAFEQLLGYCNAHGAVFNPSKASIKITALNALLTSAQQSIQAVKVARSAYDNAVIARQIAFQELPKIATRIMNTLASTDASKEVVRKANAFRQSLSASTRNRAPIPAPAGSQDAPATDARTRSSSQLDFDLRTENFAALIQLLSTEPLYKPNEANLQVAALTTLASSLRDKNKAVIQAKVAYSNARFGRNKILYDTNGIHASAMAVKKYIKGIFGPDSPQFRQVGGIVFENHKV